jgi:hypothetical protein
LRIVVLVRLSAARSTDGSSIAKTACFPTKGQKMPGNEAAGKRAQRYQQNAKTEQNCF